MTVPRRVMEALRTIAALPEDGWEPHTWDEFLAAQKVAAEEVGRHDRNEARKVAADEQRASRAKPKKARQWKPDPPELAEAKEVVRARSGGFCEAQTPWCERYSTQVHHIAGRKGKTAHHPDNLLDVCGLGNTSGCHGWIHQHPVSARELGFLRPAGALDAVYDTKQVLR